MCMSKWIRREMWPSDGLTGHVSCVGVPLVLNMDQARPIEPHDASNKDSRVHSASGLSMSTDFGMMKGGLGCASSKSSPKSSSSSSYRS